MSLSSPIAEAALVLSCDRHGVTLDELLAFAATESCRCAYVFGHDACLPCRAKVAADELARFSGDVRRSRS